MSKPPPTDVRRRPPVFGPEALDLLFKLGTLATDQVRALLPRSLAPSSTRKLLAALKQERLILSQRRKCAYFEATSAARWKTIHRLSEEGLLFVAERQDLFPSVARSLYGRVLREATVDHALLRNEFYALLARTLHEAQGPSAADLFGVGITILCAEAGMTPIELGRKKEGRRRYLNPDGLLELRKEGDADFRPRYLVESDTGSQDMPWQISRKAERYAEYMVGLLEGGTPQPHVLFISPTAARSRWVRDVFLRTGTDREALFFEARGRFSERELRLPDLFLFTNLEWISTHGPLGNAYRPLGANSLGPLFD